MATSRNASLAAHRASSALPRALQGLSSALVEKIRAKEAAAAADAAAAPTVRRRQLALQAPALASAVRQCIIMAKGRAKTRLCMSYDELLRRLAQAGACQAASAAEVASRLDALAAAVPQWFSLRALPSGERVVAIENGVDIDALTKELAAAAAAADGA